MPTSREGAADAQVVVTVADTAADTDAARAAPVADDETGVIVHCFVEHHELRRLLAAMVAADIAGVVLRSALSTTSEP
jgi:hypothetical protein